VSQPEWPHDALALMRSRYAAYASGDVEWILASWHPSTRPPGALQLEPGTKWLGLEVKDHRRIDDDHAEVEFVARFRIGGGRAQRLHERSRFVREGGHWYYVDGVVIA
jgi:SEC-C motif-containing protein